MTSSPRQFFRRVLLSISAALVALAALLWYYAPGDLPEWDPAAFWPSSPDTDEKRLSASEHAGAEVRSMVGTTNSMMIVVQSEPSGAVLTVDGREHGETPAGLDTRCSKDIPITIEVTATGYRRWRRKVPCQPGIELRFTARLRRR